MFSIILFLICFCIASIALYEPAIEPSTTVDNFDQFYSAVKEVFALEPEVEAESVRPLSSAQSDIYYQSILSKPTAQSSSLDSKFTIRQLVRFVD
jgi:hypothetical protein